ncbi:MAG: 1-acyl-sn-glycerol-3-phosphate acyltransferase [Clostridia bacterium]|nr:1-acyl-sn-glycerol-3-phosphate acyltransferase [Clostridia bacterium]
MFIRFVRVVITAFYAVFHPLRVEGRERIPGEGAFILALNHTSFLDAFTAFLLLPNDARYMAKKELFRHQPLKWFITKIGAFPVDRSGNDMDAMRTALAALKDGHPLTIFPEGHRYKDGFIHELKTGTAFIAMRAGVNVIPARVHTSYRPFARVFVCVGEPIVPEGRVSSAALEDYTAQLKQSLENL